MTLTYLIYSIFTVFVVAILPNSEQIPQAEYATRLQTQIIVRQFKGDTDDLRLDLVRAIALRDRAEKVCNVAQMGECMIATLDPSERPVMQPLIIRIQSHIDKYRGPLAISDYNPKEMGFIHKEYELSTDKGFQWIAQYSE